MQRQTSMHLQEDTFSQHADWALELSVILGFELINVFGDDEKVAIQ